MFSCLFSWVGCNKQTLNTPEEVLDFYVHQAFSGASNEELEKYLSPEFLKTMKDSAGNETDQRISLKNLKLLEYHLIEKNCENEDKCQLRYFVSYNELNPQDSSVDFSSQTKKIAVLVKNQNNEWKIDEIDHLKTFHDLTKVINVEGKKINLPPKK